MTGPQHTSIFTSGASRSGQAEAGSADRVVVEGSDDLHTIIALLARHGADFATPDRRLPAAEVPSLADISHRPIGETIPAMEA